MKVKHECIPCVTRQVITLAEKVTEDQNKQEDIIQYGLRLIADKALDSCPPYLTGEIYNYAKGISGIKDPFQKEKETFNKIAAELVDHYGLKNKIKMSKSPLETAIRLSIAGNIIDFSLGEKIEESSVRKSIEASLESELYGGAIDGLIDAIEAHEDIMILADNAGEIVFDKLLIDLLGNKRVTYVVKGGPIVNDATMADVEAVGLTGHVIAMDTGAAYQGILMDKSTDVFRQAFTAAPLVIAKGQANFETLNELAHDNLYFLLRGKCHAVAEVIGCQKGAFVCLKNEVI